MKVLKKRYFVCFIFGCLLYFFLIRQLIYLYFEFIISVNVNVEICDTCSMKLKNDALKTKNISNIVHQIFFPVKSKTLPGTLMGARASCIQKNKEFTHYLWNETEVIKFIRREYPHMEKRYKSYNYWVRRVNVARYLILYHYGGWYVDLDMTCVNSFSSLAEKAYRENKSVVQHYTFPFGTSNDFFGVTPRHQFLMSVLDHLPNSDRWFIFPYFNTVLTTGTTYMWGRYLNYPYKDEFMILEPEGIRDYIEHHHDSAWHGWDAQLIRFFVHYYHILLALTVILIVVYAAFCLCVRTSVRKKFINDINDNISKIL